MSLSYAPNIILPKDAIAPDNYTFIPGVMPEDNFVISKNKHGEVLSVFGDLSWNRTPYSPNGKTAWLRFPFWNLESMDLLQQSLHKDAKWIIFIMMWYRTGIPLSHTTLQRHCNLLQTISKYCYNKNIKFLDFFNDYREIKEFSESKEAQSYLNNFSMIISDLRRIPPEISGYNICSPKKITFLSNKLSLKKQNNKQTSPIPTRIYSELISNISAEIEYFLKVSDKIFILIKKCLESPVYGRGKYALLKHNSTSQNKMQKQPSFLEVLVEHDLLEYFKKNDLTLSVLGINSLLSNIQILAKLQIHVFTGMRDSEVNNLPYDCLEKTVSNGVSHHLINGYTTKFNNGLRKEVRWVTSDEGHKAIKVAQKIADLIYSYLKIEDKLKDKLLFISTAYLPFTIKPLTVNSDILTPTDFRLGRYDSLLKRICPIIEEQDIIELENIDLHRDWRGEKDYQIGRFWTIKTHQLRRSLALYAQRTGLVSLPSLRRQLQHITNEMSMYYAKGSSYAKNLINEDKDHFGNEWQKSQPVSSALSYIANVLLSEEPLIGGHGNWVEHRLKNNKNTIIIESREETIKRFKKGELAYKETLLGGCTKIGDCDQPALNWLDTDCLTNGCKNMVCNVSKLEKVIIAQEKLVNSLEKSSLEYRTEKADLDILVSAKNKLMKG